MILVVLLNIGGIVALALAAMVAVTSGPDAMALFAAAPVLLSALVLLGMAQVILALLRTAAASEAAHRELAEINDAQQKMAEAFDRLGRRQT